MDRHSKGRLDPNLQAAVDDHMLQAFLALGRKFFGDPHAFSLSKDYRPPGHLFTSETRMYAINWDRLMTDADDLCPFRGNWKDAHKVYPVLVFVGIDAATPLELSVLQKIALGNMIQPGVRDLEMMINFLGARGYRVQRLETAPGKTAGLDAERRYTVPAVEALEVSDDMVLLLSLINLWKGNGSQHGQSFDLSTVLGPAS